MDTDFLAEQMKLYNTNIDDIGFSEHILRCLRWHGYTTIGKLARMNVPQILKIPGIFEDDCKEIVEKLGAIGIIIDSQAKKPKKHHYDKPSKFPYPNNLIAAIRDTDPHELNEEYFSMDQLMGISVALSSLTEQEETMIILRYKHGATLDQIGNFYGLTNERARQLIHQALRKLRHPARYRLIDQGLRRYIENEAEKRSELKVSNLLHLEYFRGYHDGIDAATISDDDKKKLINEKLLQTALSDLDISIRTFNTLSRANVKTLGDLLAYDSVDTIYKIRNMGHKSAVEIAKLLSRYGICNDAWESFLTIKTEE